MNIKKNNFHHFWIAFSFAAILVIALFDAIIITSTDTLQVQYVPDDAYYYLTLAKNFTIFGNWTFDSGHSVTSGFHPLLAFLLASFYWIAKPSTYEFAQFGIIVGSLLTIITLFVVWKFCLQFNKPYYLLVFTLIVSSKNFVYNSVSGTEWALVILISSLYSITLWHSYFSDKYLVNAVILFLIGFLGSLARSDFGLIPLFCLLFCLFLFYIDNKKYISFMALSGLLGSVFGVVFIFLYNFSFTNMAFQSSAMMKAYWAQIYGSNYIGILKLIASILGIEIVNLGFLAYILGASLIFFLLIVNIMKKPGSILTSKEVIRVLALMLAAILCCLGYLLFYLRNAVIQSWYSANLVLPFFVIVLGLFILADRVLENNNPIRVISLIAVLIIFSNIYNLFPISESNSIWPHQKFMLFAGKDLSQHEIDGQVGSWNAGIIGYYQGGGVINLDGLVNNDIYEFATTNTLPVYISGKRIRYILDFENMLAEDMRRKRGGYDDMVFIASLKPIKEFGDGNNYWKHLTLYEIKP